MRIRFGFYACIAAIWWLAACSGSRTTEPTRLPPPSTPTSSASEPLVLVGTELLGSASVTTQCDASDGLEFDCPAGAAAPLLLQTDLPASQYARWSLRWDDSADSLTGEETLYLEANRAGNLTPNLYLVERNGKRTPVNLGRLGLQDGTNELWIPLREFVDENGDPPKFSEIVEIQVVFEWADMDGELALEALHFEPVWQEAIAVSASSIALASELQIPEGFVVEAVADNLREITQIDFSPDGDMWISQQNGRIWTLSDTDADGVFDQRRLYTTGFGEIVGLLYDPSDGGVWIGGRGRLLRTLDNDDNGVADTHELLVDGLPWGRHQNNGLAWNPDPDPFTGEAGSAWIYFGLGSTEDLEVGGKLNATVLRFPRDGQGQDDLEVVSRGNRNAYAVVWAPVPVDPGAPDGATAWQLFASENGPDFNDASDEVNHVRWQHHFGFPVQFGMVEDETQDGLPYSSPVYPVAAHASASGLAYINNPAWPPEYRTLYVSLFGQVFDPEIVGHTVERITLLPTATATGDTYRGEPSDFVVGLDRPLPLAKTPEGDLLVGDYATGVLYRISYGGE